MSYHRFKLLITCVFSAFSIASWSQDIIVVQPINIGAAGILTVNATDGIASINPAMMSAAKGFSIEVGHTIPYALKELSQTNAKVVVPTKLINIAGQVAICGDETSRYTQFGGGFSRDFNHWALGLEYYGIIHKLTDDQKFTASFSRIGLHFYPNEKWLLSVALHNIERSQFEYKYTKTDIEPAAFIGLKWKASGYFALMLEAEKRFDHDPIGKVAAAIYPTKRFDLTVGFSTRGQSLSAGIGYSIKGLALHVAIMSHEQLGMTSGASIGYTFGE